MHTDYDIGIVGGGLAGLCLALLSVDAGYSVVLFEKEQYPFNKVCGEYISFESYNFLVLLGLPLHDWNLPEIKKLELSDMQGRLYNFRLDTGGFGISRYTIYITETNYYHHHNQFRIHVSNFFYLLIV